MPTSIDGGVAELAAQQHGVFSIEQLNLLGLDKRFAWRRCHAGRWDQLYRGVYRIGGTPVTKHQLALAAVLACGRGAVMARSGAAWLHGFSGFAFSQDVARPAKATHFYTSVQHHETTLLPRHHVTKIDSIPVTTAGRTLFDLAAELSLGRMARVLDNALSAKQVTVVNLLRMHAELAKRGRGGIVNMRVLLNERADGYVVPESELERQFLRLCDNNSIPTPRKQVVLGTQARLVGRVDFVFADEKLVIEVDGRRWHLSISDRENDYARDAAFVAMGYRVMRLTWNQVKEEPVKTANLVLASLGRA